MEDCISININEINEIEFHRLQGNATVAFESCQLIRLIVRINTRYNVFWKQSQRKNVSDRLTRRIIFLLVPLRVN